MMKIQNYTDDIIARYNGGQSLSQIAAIYGVTSKAILYLLKKNHIPRRSIHDALALQDRCHCVMRHDAFDAITEESAYWIGFLMADGNVMRYSDRQPVISLCLSARDADHVARFKQFLDASYTLRLTDTTATLAVVSRHLADVLEDYGVTPRKSRTAQVAPSLEDNRHFWRGVIDGDGTLRMARYEQKLYPVLKLCGALPLVTQFGKFTFRATGLSSNVKPHSTIYAIHYFGANAVKIASLLYVPCTIALPRKLAIATQMITAT